MEYISLADDSEIEVPKTGSVKIKMCDGTINNMLDNIDMWQNFKRI